jgi:anti-sigma regulatory factor (Ser/Thr protein kinase)
MPPVLVVEDPACDDLCLRQRVAQCGFTHCGLDSLVIPERIDDAKSLGIDDCSLILTAGFPTESGFRPFLSSLRRWFPGVPVVTVTGRRTRISSKEAIESGVAGCLPCCRIDTDLLWILQTILVPNTAGRFDADSRRAFCYIIDNNPELLPLVVAQVRQQMEDWQFDNPMELMRVTVALSEALDNALYHGNLELSSELRQGTGHDWRNESQLRRSTEPYCDRQIRFRGIIGSDSARFTVRDEGSGFDAASPVDCTESQNLEQCSGRGLFLMRAYMDDVQFNGSGNEVTLVKRRPGTS